MERLGTESANYLLLERKENRGKGEGLTLRGWLLPHLGPVVLGTDMGHPGIDAE
jgi:hypothetical protein